MFQVQPVTLGRIGLLDLTGRPYLPFERVQAMNTIATCSHSPGAKGKSPDRQRFDFYLSRLAALPIPLKNSLGDFLRRKRVAEAEI